ncbi:MAG TPA: MarR family winged helix-turn-helix transcriptional regulator [Dokdonella sp.]|uniref:MarR family winged helix-turn-helix transcriptional regulator n=1 Tax=Dokdonella sp. TaxID=2291710 RepID=UPI002D7EAD68|nr:MarR family winged helix-turn-helix transcriptional regulator [Dokdonella sp.]HET9031533.1 MarR family winged helix-turn-helix transcriptional regulator [Dokdonella sp.]
MPGHALLELESFLPYRLSVLSNTLSQAIARVYEKRFDLSVTEWRTMAVLGYRTDISAREVAERTAMDKVAISRAVARLMKKGLIERNTSRHDKRQSMLRLSDEGWKIYDQVVPLAIDHEKRLLSHLDVEEREWLARILDTLWKAELDEAMR